MLGGRIRRKRAELKFGQVGFTRYRGLVRTYHGKIERGQRDVSLETLVWLAAHLETSVSDLTQDLSAEVCLSFVEHEKEQI